MIYGDEELIRITKKEFLAAIEDMQTKNISISGLYAKKMKEAVSKKKESRVDYYKEMLDTSGGIFVENEKLKERVEVEDGYSIYTMDLDGIPSLIPCTKMKYNENYDKHGNVRQPKYIA